VSRREGNCLSVERASAVIAAAGSGERLGAGGPKALVELAGRPLLAYSLDACRDAARVDAVVVAAPPGAEREVERLIDEAGLADVASVVAGGVTRAESVRRALEPVATPLVAVHDAARPLAAAGLFDAILETLDAHPDAKGVLAAAALTDTVKRACEPRSGDGDHPRGGSAVAETLGREYLWASQTPQAFRADALRDAQAEAARRGDLGAATDEAMLLERSGDEVLIHPAPAGNIKVTRALDLQIAKLLLAARS
jgi:2-C-methyl-D-erythritol 4-phosphate cytidylyltransferase